MSTTTKDIRVGDVVRLKSGGPPMTVTVLLASGCVVEWFVGHETQQRSFPATALAKQERWQLGWRAAR